MQQNYDNQNSQWQGNPPPAYYSPPQYYHPVQGMPPPPGYIQKSRVIAGMLAFFLSPFGIHHFYLGNKSKGLTQLLITLLTFGVGALVIKILSIVEGVKILDKRINTDAFGFYLKD